MLTKLPALLALAFFFDTQISLTTKIVGQRVSCTASTKTCILQQTPRNLALYKNGLRQERSVDYTITQGKIVLVEPIDGDDVFLADYEY